MDKKTKLNKFDILQAKLNNEVFLDNDLDKLNQVLMKSNFLIYSL